jgi:hypothetical protein
MIFLLLNIYFEVNDMTELLLELDQCLYHIEKKLNSLEKEIEKIIQFYKNLLNI